MNVILLNDSPGKRNTFAALNEFLVGKLRLIGVIIHTSYDFLNH
ncbi:MAG TPA: hypothetical protein VKY57_07350 [Chitinispirillaceae bacterium]|nr:hypothetical protein [Chitinispirillaceae bacterium]